MLLTLNRLDVRRLIAWIHAAVSQACPCALKFGHDPHFTPFIIIDLAIGIYRWYDIYRSLLGLGALCMMAIYL